MAMQQYNGNGQILDTNWLERILFEIGDVFKIRIVWDGETAFLAGALAVAGGILGGLAGGRLGATLGAGIGGAAGFGTAKIVSLRDIWEEVKPKLKMLLYIIYNYLRTLDPTDYLRAYEILIASHSTKQELVMKIIDFMSQTLGRQILYSL